MLGSLWLETERAVPGCHLVGAQCRFWPGRVKGPTIWQGRDEEGWLVAGWQRAPGFMHFEVGIQYKNKSWRDEEGDAMHGPYVWNPCPQWLAVVAASGATS